MSKIIRGIFIDSKNKKVEEVQLESGLDAMYSKIECGCVTAIDIADGETLWLDDEGFLKAPPEEGGLPGFRYEGYPQTLAGNALIFGLNEEGESVSSKMSVEEIANKILFQSITPEQQDEILDASGKVYSLTPEQMEAYWEGNLDLRKLTEVKCGN